MVRCEAACFSQDQPPWPPWHGGAHLGVAVVLQGLPRGLGHPGHHGGQVIVVGVRVADPEDGETEAGGEGEQGGEAGGGPHGGAMVYAGIFRTAGASVRIFQQMTVR